MLSKKYAFPALLSLLLVLTVFIYMPGLNGDFIFDDYANIVSNDKAQMESLTWPEFRKVLESGLATSLSRPLSMLTFGLNSYFSGMEAHAMKLTNLLIHLVNCVGIYLLTRQLLTIANRGSALPETTGKAVALLVTACWALHPLNVSTVLYVVQRMTLLSATASIYTLLYYCRFRLKPECSASRALLAIGALAAAIVVGVLFKENALLVVLYIVCIEFFLFRFAASNRGHALFLKVFMIGMVAIPAVVGTAGLLLRPGFVLDPYEIRNFTLVERLLTQPRVLWMYLDWLVMPDLRELAFYYDNYLPSRSLLQPPTTLYSLLGLLALGTVSLLARQRLPMFGFGIALFLAGHTMESTFLGLELVFEHRNYMPGFGIMLAVCCGLLGLPARLLSKQLTTMLLAFYLLFLTHGSWLEVRKWSDTYEHLSTMLRNNPGSHRLNYGMGFFLMDLAAIAPDNGPVLTLSADFFRKAAALDDKTIRGHAGVIQAESQLGIETDPALVAELYERVRSTPKLENYITEISNLTQCWYSGFCRFSNEVLVGLYNAMAQNRQSESVVVQGILAQIGTAAAYIFNRPLDGLAVLQLARNLRPEFTIIDVTVIELEIATGQLDAARFSLESAKRRADPVADAATLAELEALLAAAE